MAKTKDSLRWTILKPFMKFKFMPSGYFLHMNNFLDSLEIRERIYEMIEITVEEMDHKIHYDTFLKVRLYCIISDKITNTN